MRRSKDKFLIIKERYGRTIKGKTGTVETLPASKKVAENNFEWWKNDKVILPPYEGYDVYYLVKIVDTFKKISKKEEE